MAKMIQVILPEKIQMPKKFCQNIDRIFLSIVCLCHLQTIQIVRNHWLILVKTGINLLKTSMIHQEVVVIFLPAIIQLPKMFWQNKLGGIFLATEYLCHPQTIRTMTNQTMPAKIRTDLPKIIRQCLLKILVPKRFCQIIDRIFWEIAYPCQIMMNQTMLGKVKKHQLTKMVLPNLVQVRPFK